MLKIYGIKNCNSMKKAFDLLNELGLAYEFHDYKKQGIDAETLKHWLDAEGQDKILNKKGTTWRKLDPAVQASVIDEASAAAVLQAHVSVIKRPVVEWTDGRITVGFQADAWAIALGL